MIFEKSVWPLTLKPAGRQGSPIFLDSPFRVGVEYRGKSIEFDFCHVPIKFFHTYKGGGSKYPNVPVPMGPYSTDRFPTGNTKKGRSR